MKSKQNAQRILLDTSFLMPTIGIEVEKQVLDTVSKIQPGKYEILYSNLSLLECTWMAIKQMKASKYREEIFRKGVLSIAKTGYYNLIHEDAEDYLYALQLYQMGHIDMIDNLLYAIALRNECSFLTIDRELQEFIDKNDVRDVILTPEEF